jgi:hypothetical protein
MTRMARGFAALAQLAAEIPSGHRIPRQVLFLAAVPAAAHRAFAAEFDVDKPVKVRGTIAKIELGKSARMALCGRERS